MPSRWTVRAILCSESPMPDAPVDAALTKVRGCRQQMRRGGRTINLTVDVLAEDVSEARWAALVALWSVEADLTGYGCKASMTADPHLA